MTKVSIIIPCFNEELSIGHTLHNLHSLVDQDTEIIVINDGSSDDSKKVIDEFTWVKVIHHQKNLGYGASIKSGIRSSQNSDFILWVDADGQHTKEDISNILNYVKTNPNCDLVIGSRSKNSAAQRNRVFGKLILSRVANYLMADKIPDLNSGLRAIKVSIILKYLYLLPNTFSASTTSTLLFYKLNKYVHWIPITTLERVGKSSVRQIKHGSYSILLIIRIIMMFNPLKFFAPIGFLLLFIGLTWGLYYYSSDSISTFSAILMTSGLNILLIGLLADQIVLQNFRDR